MLVDISRCWVSSPVMLCLICTAAIFSPWLFKGLVPLRSFYSLRKACSLGLSGLTWQVMHFPLFSLKKNLTWHMLYHWEGVGWSLMFVDTSEFTVSSVSYRPRVYRSGAMLWILASPVSLVHHYDTSSSMYAAGS